MSVQPNGKVLNPQIDEITISNTEKRLLLTRKGDKGDTGPKGDSGSSTWPIVTDPIAPMAPGPSDPVTVLIGYINIVTHATVNLPEITEDMLGKSLLVANKRDPKGEITIIPSGSDTIDTDTVITLAQRQSALIFAVSLGNWISV
jgi:hypothetical protein